MEKYLNGEEVPVDLVKKAIRKGTLAVEFFPVTVGSAKANMGVKFALDAVIDYLPSPLDIDAAECLDAKGNENEENSEGNENEENPEGNENPEDKDNGAIRSQVSRDVLMRHTPELIFKLDSSQDYGAHIDAIIEEINKQPKSED